MPPHIGLGGVRFGGGGAPAWTPASSANLVAWWESNLGSPTVSLWPDQSGNGHNLVQNNALRQATYNASGGVNNLPYFESTVNAAMAAAIPALAQPFEYMLLAATGPVASGKLCDFGSNNVVTEIFGGDLIIYNGAILTGPAAAANTLYVLDNVLDDPNSSLGVNGGTPAVGSAGSGSGTPTFTLMNYGGLGFGWLGPVYGAFIWSAPLSSGDAANMKAYLLAKYGAP